MPKKVVTKRNWKKPATESGYHTLSEAQESLEPKCLQTLGESLRLVHTGCFYCLLRLAMNDEERKNMQMGSDDQIAWHTYAGPSVE